MKPVITSLSPRQRQGGLTLIEIMVASALLLVITLGLTAMFNQTQKAFRTGLKNADVYEGARSVMDLVSRDMEQIARGAATNLHVVDSPTVPIGAALPDNSTRLHDFCFLTQISNRWIGVGYKLTSPNMAGGVGIGQLFRFVTNYGSSLQAGNLINDFNAATPDQLRHVYDGVVHMRVLPFSTNGYLPYDLSGAVKIDSFPPGTYVGPATNFFDFSNSVPAYVQLEMAVLEPQNFEQLKGIPIGPAQTGYVLTHANKIHVFRQQIPIRSAQR